MSYVFKPLFLPIFLILVLLACTPALESNSSSAHRSPDDLGLPFNNSLLPAGTPMVIPQWVLEQYAANGQNYGDPLNFLILNYGKAGLVPNHPNQHSYYIPLQVQDRPESSYKKKRSRDRRGSRRHRRSSWTPRKRDPTVMVDVLKLQIQKNTGTSQPSVPAKERPTTPEPKPSTPTTSPPESTKEPQPQPKPEQKKGSSSPSTPEPTSAGAGNQQADPRPSTESSASTSPAVDKEVVLETTEKINTATTPPVLGERAPIILKDNKQTPTTSANTASAEETPPDATKTDKIAPAEAPQATCDESEQNTEAKAPCVACVKAVNESWLSIQNFLTSLGKQTDAQIKKKEFSKVVTEFCQKCAGKDVRAFFSYMEERAKENNVPKEILFAIMMRESNGDCNVIQKSTKCHGLFQLNPTNSTKLRACKKDELKGKTPDQLKSACSKGKYRNTNQYKDVQYPKIIKKNKKRIPKPADFLDQRKSISDMVCLENPYCNFEEALHLLIEEKWPMVNKGKPPPSLKGQGKWVDLSADERNQWRNALVAYHGNFYHHEAKKAMREELEVTVPLDDWEHKRLWFIKQYLLQTNQKKKDGLIYNLAYVESLAGREIKGGLAHSSICQWDRYQTENPNPSCPASQ